MFWWWWIAPTALAIIGVLILFAGLASLFRGKFLAAFSAL